MTVIAAAADETRGSVWMGSDTGSIRGDARSHAAPKVLRCYAEDGAPFLLGFAGTTALAAVVSRKLSAPAAPALNLDPDSWAGGVAEAICRAALDSTPPVVDSDGWIDGGAILGFRGRLWQLFQQDASPIPSGWTAIGSGEGYALGHLSATADSNFHAHDRVDAAIRAACMWDTGCWIGPTGPRILSLP